MALLGLEVVTHQLLKLVALWTDCSGDGCTKLGFRLASDSQSNQCVAATETARTDGRGHERHAFISRVERLVEVRHRGSEVADDTRHVDDISIADDVVGAVVAQREVTVRVCLRSNVQH